MGGLIIKLRPYEQVIINGIIVENGDRKSRLRILTGNAHIMRMRDTIAEEAATTPLKRAQYLAQQVIACDLTPGDASSQIKQVLQTDSPNLSRELIREIQQFIDLCVANDDFYRVVQYLREKSAHTDQAASAPAAFRQHS